MIYLDKLILYNFRCFTNLEINFSNKINILVGDNAVGKTSIVEAIHCLGFVKSHRAVKDQQLIKIGTEHTMIKGAFINEGLKSSVSLGITERGKKIIYNNKAYTNLSDYLGFLNIVMFCPEDLELVKGSPAVRRRFLDSNLSQINKKYLRSSINYKKVLKERNELLKLISESEQKNFDLLNIYTQELVNEAQEIIKMRKKFIAKINPYIKKNTEAISAGEERASIEYLGSVAEENLEKKFKDNLKNDLYYKTTTLGPHRDDFKIDLNKRSVAQYGSQGQQRTAVLALKLALAELINENNNNLIVILDDVFSELDQNRQNKIINLLSGSNQIFITTTSIDNLGEDVLKNSEIKQIYKESEVNGEY